MVDPCITSSRAALVGVALIPLAAGCAARKEPVAVERTVVRTTEVDADARRTDPADPAPPATTRATVAVTETVVYDQGEPHYPGKYFAGGRGGGGGGGGGGGPSGGLPGYGPYGRFRVNGPFLIGASLDFFEYEFDDPGEEIGITPLTPWDAEVESTAVTVWGEYEFQALGRSGVAARVRPFVAAGVGVGFLSGDDLTGVTTGGDPFDLEVDGDVELIPMAMAGVRIDLTDNFILELGARYDYHFTDLEITDNVTGASEDVDDFDTFGGYVGVQFRW